MLTILDLQKTRKSPSWDSRCVRLSVDVRRLPTFPLQLTAPPTIPRVTAHLLLHPSQSHSHKSLQPLQMPLHLAQRDAHRLRKAPQRSLRHALALVRRRQMTELMVRARVAVANASSCRGSNDTRPIGYQNLRIKNISSPARGKPNYARMHRDTTATCHIGKNYLLGINK